MDIYLLHLWAWNEADRRLDEFRFATAPGYISWTDDDPPATPYPPLIEEIGPATLAISTYGETRGPTRVQVRDLVLDNRIVPETGKRPLSVLATAYQTAGWPAHLYVLGAGERRSQAQLIAVLTMEGRRPERSRLRIGFRDRALDADTPVLVQTYSGGGGLDGVANLKDRTRERSWGLVPNAEPTYLGVVNSRHTYSVNGGKRIKGFLEVRDRMALLTEVAGDPTAKQWSQDRATGILTVGGNPEQITARWEGDMTGGVYRETPADIKGALAIEGGFATAEHLAGVADLNARFPHPVHLWLSAGDTTTYRAAWDALAACADGFWLLDEDLRFVVGAVTPPSGPPVRRFVAGVDTPGLTSREAADRGVPVSKVRIGWGRNHKVMARGDLAILSPSVTDEVISFATSDYRYAESPADPDTEAACPTARTVTRETLCSTRAGGEALAALLQADLRTPRGVWDLPTTVAAGEVRRLDVVEVVDDVPGYETGRLVRVIGRRLPVGNDAGLKNSFVVRE